MTRSTWFRRLTLSVIAIASVAAIAVPDQLAAADEFAPLDYDNADPESRARAATLQERGAVIQRRTAYKEQLVAGLIEQRYRLEEVAREFALVIAEDEVNLAILRQTYAGSTDEVRAARNVIDYARTQPMPEYQASLATARLQAEFRQLYPRE